MPSVATYLIGSEEPSFRSRIHSLACQISDDDDKGRPFPPANHRCAPSDASAIKRAASLVGATESRRASGRGAGISMLVACAGRGGAGIDDGSTSAPVCRLMTWRSVPIHRVVTSICGFCREVRRNWQPRFFAEKREQPLIPPIRKRDGYCPAQASGARPFAGLPTPAARSAHRVLQHCPIPASKLQANALPLRAASPQQRCDRADAVVEQSRSSLRRSPTPTPQDDLLPPKPAAGLRCQPEHRDH